MFSTLDYRSDNFSSIQEASNIPEEFKEEVKRGIFRCFDDNGLRYVRSSSYGAIQSIKVVHPVYINRDGLLTDSIPQITCRIGSDMWNIVHNQMHLHKEVYAKDKSISLYDHDKRTWLYAMAFAEMADRISIIKEAQIGYNDRYVHMKIIVHGRIGFLDLNDPVLSPKEKFHPPCGDLAYRLNHIGDEDGLYDADGLCITNDMYSKFYTR